MESQDFRIVAGLKPHLHRVDTTQVFRHVVKQGDEGSRLRRCASKLSVSSSFHRFVSCVILLNFVAMIIETDQLAREDRNQDIILWAEILGWASLTMFIIELMVRLIARGRSFWQDPWDVVDFMVISMDGACSVIGIVAGSVFPVSILRTLRLVKLAKVSKISRVFPELRLLLAALIGSLSAIFWGTVLLMVVTLLWSMVAVTIIHPLAKDIEYENCERCPRAYSSVMSAALTFWQTTVASDNWGQYTIPVLENHPATLMFFMPLYLTIGIAVLHLILGVVVDVAMESKETLLDEDRKEMALTELRKKTKLLEFCADMDPDRCGLLSCKDLRDAFMRPGGFRDCVLSLGISDEDFDVVWAVINTDNKGAVSYKEFVNNISSLKHSDSHFMLTYIKYYITVMQENIKNILKKEEDLLEKEEVLVKGLDKEGSYLSRIEIKEDEILRCQTQLLEEAAVAPPKLEARCAARPSDRPEIHPASACLQQNAAGARRKHTESCRDVSAHANAQSVPYLECAELPQTAAAAAPLSEIQLPEHSRLQKTAASSGEKAPIMSDNVDVWSERICDAMAIFQDEIKNIIVNMKFELEAQGVHKSSVVRAKANMKEQKTSLFNVSSWREVLLHPNTRLHL